MSDLTSVEGRAALRQHVETLEAHEREYGHLRTVPVEDYLSTVGLARHHLAASVGVLLDQIDQLEADAKGLGALADAAALVPEEEL